MTLSWRSGQGMAQSACPVAQGKHSQAKAWTVQLARIQAVTWVIVVMLRWVSRAQANLIAQKRCGRMCVWGLRRRSWH